jgi:nitrogen regulatory protein PII
MPNRQYDVIVTIIKRGLADRIVKASKAAGAEGGTILHGRGTGIHEQKVLLGLVIEPEKDIVLTVITTDLTEKVLQAIVEAGELDKPATGIAFVVPLKAVAGIVHHQDAC